MSYFCPGGSPANAAWAGKLLIVTCTNGSTTWTEYYRQGSSPPSVQASVDYWSGYPIRGRALLTSPDYQTVVFEVDYGSTKRRISVDLAPGNNVVYFMPALPSPSGGWSYAQAVNVYTPQQGLVASVAPTTSRYGVPVQQFCVSADAPQAALLQYVGSDGPAYSLHTSLYSTEACMLLPSGNGYYSFVVLGNGAVVGDNGGYAKTSSANVYVIVPGSAAATAAAASAQQAQPPPLSFLSFLASLPGAAVSVVNQVEKAAGAALDALSAVGARAESAAAAAWNWMTNTKVQIGPFSITVAQIAVTAGLTAAAVLAPEAVPLISAGLESIGLSSAAASALGWATYGAAVGGVAFALGKLQGEGDVRAALDALSWALFAGVPPLFSGFWGQLADMAWRAAVPAAIGAFVPGDKPVPNPQTTTSDNGAVARVLNKACFDPYYSILPMSACSTAASNAPIPVAAISSASWSGSAINVTVVNYSSQPGQFVVTDGVDSKAVYLAPGQTASVSLAAPQAQTAEVQLLYSGVVIDSREVQAQQSTQQLPLDQLVELAAVYALAKTIAGLGRSGR